MSENSVHQQVKFKIIVTIVKKGMGSKVVAASKKAGAEGGTILFGRGTADEDIYQNILGIAFEPEKEIILTVVQEQQVENVLNAIALETKLNRPGKGVGFVIDIKNAIGIAHLLQLQNSDE